MLADRFKGTFYDRIALLGTGLIGGSLGIRLRERRLVKEVAGYDRDPNFLRMALERGAIDLASSSPQEAVRGAQLIILAVPILSMAGLVKQVRPALERGAVISDVGSTKAQVIDELEPLLPKEVYIIGGHPMAGSEEAGIKHADPAMLENAIYVLTPSGESPPEAVEKLVSLVEATGAQPLIMDPVEHDQVIALVSHLPHLVAAALAGSVSNSEKIELVRTLAAGGFRDTTRIALGNPEIWRDICISNSAAILQAMTGFEQMFKKLYKLVARREAGQVEEALGQARDFRRSIPYRGRGILPELYELVVLVPDNPGVIGELATLLGTAGINISSIEILHVRELEGGSIKLGFREATPRQAALNLLREKGYRAHCRN